MDNQNRYEDVPEKENAFVKFFKTLGSYFKSIFLDFIQGFKYNMMRIPAILLAVPGVFLGFFLTFHSEVVQNLYFEVPIFENQTLVRTEYYAGISFDFSGILLFVLMLCGILNIFLCLGVSGKKNLGSVVKCTIVSAILVIAGGLYLFLVFTCIAGKDEIFKGDLAIDYNWYISIASVIVAMLTSIIGCILGFLWYDRTYEKIDR